MRLTKWSIVPVLAVACVVASAAAPTPPGKIPYYALIELYSVDSESIFAMAEDGSETKISLDAQASQTLREIPGASFHIGDKVVPLGAAPSVVQGFVLNGAPQARMLTIPAPAPLNFSGPTRLEGWMGADGRLEFDLNKHVDNTVFCNISITSNETSAALEFPAGDGERHAFVSTSAQEKDKVLLIMVRVYRPGSAVDPELIYAAQRHFAVETKVFQIHGKPDWNFWTKPYPNGNDFVEGAGRVVGPADATNFARQSDEPDFSAVGFSGVTDDDFYPLSAPRATFALDYPTLQRTGQIYTRYKLTLNSYNHAHTPPAGIGFANISEAVNPVYDALAIQPKKLGREDLEGKVATMNVNLTSDENRRTIVPSSDDIDGFMQIMGADSTEMDGVFRLDQKLLIRVKEIATSRGFWKQDPVAFHAQFRCTADVRDGDAIAFLVPGDDDKFLLVVSTFNLTKE